MILYTEVDGEKVAPCRRSGEESKWSTVPINNNSFITFGVSECEHGISAGNIAEAAVNAIKSYLNSGGILEKMRLGDCTAEGNYAQIWIHGERKSEGADK